MNGKTTKKRSWYHLLRRGLYWAIPVIVLYIVFQRIDLAAFKLNIARTNPWMVALGVGHFPLMILIGALRWRLLLTQYHRRKVQMGFVLKHYWIGLALGVFAPGSIGWDVYRVIASGRRFGQYALNMAIIVVEKLMALVACMSLIMVLYPVVPITPPLEIEWVFHLAYILFFASVLLIAVMTFALRNRVLSMLLERLEIYFADVLEKIGGRFGLGDKAKDTGIPFRAMMEPLTVPKQMLPILILSWGIQLVGAVGGQVFFRALGYDLPFIVNLFTSPVLFFVFLLPISFGSLGIREGAFILLYSLFGVPAETALLVSFFSLSGLLLNNLIGGVIMMLSNVKRESLTKTTFP